MLEWSGRVWGKKVVEICRRLYILRLQDNYFSKATAPPTWGNFSKSGRTYLEKLLDVVASGLAAVMRGCEVTLPLLEFGTKLGCSVTAAGALLGLW